MASPPKSPPDPKAASDERPQAVSNVSGDEFLTRPPGTAGAAKVTDTPPAPPSAVPKPDDDEEDEDLIVFTARQAAGAFATIYHFTLPFLKNYKKGVAIVAFGLLVETLFNVIMPLSLKFLIDDALNEEDTQTLYRILTVLAVA